VELGVHVRDRGELNEGGDGDGKIYLWGFLSSECLLSQSVMSLSVDCTATMLFLDASGDDV
jgi:hypothetical protein